MKAKAKRLKELLDKGVLTQDAYCKAMEKLGLEPDLPKKVVASSSASSQGQANAQPQRPVIHGPEDEAAEKSLNDWKYQTQQSDGGAQKTVVEQAHAVNGITFDTPNVDIEEVERRAAKLKADGKPSKAYEKAMEAMERAKRHRGPDGGERGSRGSSGGRGVSLDVLRSKGFNV